MYYELKIPPLTPHSLARFIYKSLKERPIPGITEQTILDLLGEGNTNLKALNFLFKHPTLFTSTASVALPDRLVTTMLNTLSQEDQEVFLLTALFKSVLNIDVLIEMGNSQYSWCFSEIKGYTRDQIRQALTHAEELCLITHIEGRYYLLDEFVINCLKPELQKRVSFDKACAAFVNAMSLLSRDLAQRWEDGNKEQIGLLNAEETNLKNALILAHRNNWKDSLPGLLMGLRLVYIQSRRYLPWARLLNTIARDYLTIHGKLHQDISDEANLYGEYCVEVNKLRERFIEAANWQKLRVDWERQKARSVLHIDPQELDGDLLQKIINLALALSTSGELLMNAGSPKAIEAYKDAFRLVKSLKKNDLAAKYAYCIADGYISISASQDLKLAQQWIKRSLKLRDKTDLVGIGKSTALLGKLALEKFAVVRKENQPVKVQIDYLNEALGYFFQTLDWLPENAMAELGMVHENIGYAYLQTENALDIAVGHYNQAVKFKKQVGDNYGAAKSNFNLAVALFMLAQFEPGRHFAREALGGFESLGKEAEWDVQKTRGLLARFSNPLAFNN